MARKLYTTSAVDRAIAELTEYGFECNQIHEGTLGCGYWICVPPKDGMYHRIFKEVYLNCWSSAHTMDKRIKLTKSQQADLAAYYEREEVSA